MNFRKLIFFSLLFSCNTIVLHAQQDQWSSSQLYKELNKLRQTTRVLYIAAHPDDENTRMLTYLANGRQFETAYLSLTRGDGGQNLIGEEQGKYLGLIRASELMAARSIDGARQFFTRAVDFGYSKSADETLSLWGKDSILADVVWVIRNFKPDIIITRFPPDERAGHGHHTTSAILALEAFEAAADPMQFPNQLQYTSTWQVNRVFWNASSWWDNTLPDRVDNKTVFTLDVGEYDPFLGTSYGELAGKARSQHRSQGFGVSPYRGSQPEYLILLKGAVPEGKIDPLYMPYRWPDIKGGEEWEAAIEAIIANYDFLHPEESVPALVQLYKLLGKGGVQTYGPDQQQIASCIAAAIGLWAEPVVTDIRNDEKEIQARFDVLVGSGYPVVLKSMVVKDYTKQVDIKIEKNIIYSDTLQIAFDGYPNATPYWLKAPFNSMYEVADRQLIGLPMYDELPMVEFRLLIDGEEIVFTRSLVSKYIDPAKGEIYQPVQVLPAVTVKMIQEVPLFTSNKASIVNVEVHNREGNPTGKLVLTAPPGWTVTPPYYNLTLASNSTKVLDFEVLPAQDATEGILSPHFDQGTNSFNQQVTTLAYDHIPAYSVMESADKNAVVLPWKVPARKIAYLEGAGDWVDESLKAAGLNITTLQPEDLANTNLNDFDVVMTGIRAYNVAEELVAGSQQLLEFVQQGGTLIVQYNTRNNFTMGNDEGGSSIGPYPFAVTRARTTNEFSPVAFLLTNHPVFLQPNSITQEDFNGWVQERGLYYAGEADERYVFPLGFQDPGEEMANGALMIGEYGKGVFVYTGISFFRQLPAGVSGAYKLLFNIIDLEHGNQ